MMGLSDVVTLLNALLILFINQNGRVQVDQTLIKPHGTTMNVRKVFLLGMGPGNVDLVDTRIPGKIINSAWCHKRSVCTIQCHPLLKDYFLTSSKPGEISLWDIRKVTDKHTKPVLQFKHPKKLTSSFLSADEIKTMSTCIDNNLWIFNTDIFYSDTTRNTCIIPHFRQQYEHSLQAKWNPGRNDAFFITSMLFPSRECLIVDCLVALQIFITE